VCGWYEPRENGDESRHSCPKARVAGVNHEMVKISIMLATLLFAATVVAQKPITPEDVLSIREVRELQISPDGKQVAFRVREPADPKQPRAPRAENIWVVPTDSNEPPRPLLANLKNANTPRWSPDGRWPGL